MNLYRAPYGEYNNTVIKAANDMNYYTIQWNLDTLDYSGLTGEQMWNRIKDKLNNGDIIFVFISFNILQLISISEFITKYLAFIQKFFT